MDLDVSDVYCKRDVVLHAEGHHYGLAKIARSGVAFEHGFVDLSAGKGSRAVR